MCYIQFYVENLNYFIKRCFSFRWHRYGLLACLADSRFVETTLVSLLSCYCRSKKLTLLSSQIYFSQLLGNCCFCSNEFKELLYIYSGSIVVKIVHSETLAEGLFLHASVFRQILLKLLSVFAGLRLDHLNVHRKCLQD